jgi:hypothetical protein
MKMAFKVEQNQMKGVVPNYVSGGLFLTPIGTLLAYFSLPEKSVATIHQLLFKLLENKRWFRILSTSIWQFRFGIHVSTYRILMKVFDLKKCYKC